jgi:hypothetical protein
LGDKLEKKEQNYRKKNVLIMRFQTSNAKTINIKKLSKYRKL